MNLPLDLYNKPRQFNPLDIIRHFETWANKASDTARKECDLNGNNREQELAAYFDGKATAYADVLNQVHKLLETYRKGKELGGSNGSFPSL